MALSRVNCASRAAPRSPDNIARNAEVVSWWCVCDTRGCGLYMYAVALFLTYAYLVEVLLCVFTILLSCWGNMLLLSFDCMSHKHACCTTGCMR